MLFIMAESIAPGPGDVKGGIVEDAEGVFGGSMGAAPTLVGPAISPLRLLGWWLPLEPPPPSGRFATCGHLPLARGRSTEWRCNRRSVGWGLGKEAITIDEFVQSNGLTCTAIGRS